ncbi:MAG: polysaccharide pyruvyl transferase family protein, partial [Opitutaceae bacterium]|nr:polysaccharide pyruvyl transferase family protein [Opitutaceae bacterium]
MKVGIVTIFAVPNYGAMLQSYGLSSYLRGLGIDAEVVNYRQPALEDYFRFRLGFPPALKHWMRLRAGSAFVEQRLHKSPRQLRSVDEFMREADGYDALITGSDQVWFTGPVQYYDPMFFLDLPEARARKISYAASAGGNKTFGEHEDKVRTALSRFDHIGVRDAHTASLVRPLTDKPFTHTVDPVFVHDFAELLDERPPSSEPYVLVFGDFRGTLAEVVRQVRRQTGIGKVVTLQYPCPEATLRLASVGPVEWLNWFRHASFVVTSYFHGTVVAAKFRRPFVSVPTPGRREKVSTLLEPLGPVSYTHLTL